jgi:hypothetical protein
MLKRKQIIFFIFLIIAVLFMANFALAQDFGLEQVNKSIGLEAGDPRIIAGRIVQIALSFLGLIILVLMIYAGFLWMTSGGEEEKISRAKNILKNSIIGLIITLSAWGITTFIISRLFNATIDSNGSGFDLMGSNLSSSYGLGAIGNCSVQSVYPENGQRDVPRNTSIIISFKEPVGLSSVCVNQNGDACTCDNSACSLINPEVIRLFKNSLGDACDNSCPEDSANTNITEVAVAVSSDQKTLVLTPLDYLGSQENNIYYNVKVTSDLKKSNGVSMFQFCSTSDLYWGFEVSTRLDLTPPQVVSGHLYPQPDNEQDLSNISIPATSATGEIFVKDCPNVYKPAEILSVSPEAEVDLYYHGLIEKFKVSVPADTPNRAQLFNANTNALLGIADFNDQDIVNFNGYFSLKSEDREPGSLWEIEIIPEQKADSLTLGNTVYIFSATGENNNIVVNQTNCYTEEQAANIQAKLSGHSDINVQLSGNRIFLTAKIAGSSGNNLRLETSNNSALELVPFSGGTDLENNYEIRDKKDTAMNTVIKIGFNEAMNPITLSGPASEVADYIKVINADIASLPKGSPCSSNSQCRSYNCESSVCVDDYLNGRFMISGGYKIVEFISDIECGINGCGEKVYCLPPNSQLAVEIRAADLKVCDSDQECAAFNPFKNCFLGPLGYRTCQDNNQRNYPAADAINLNGIIDSAFNSLDGNRDSVADGPITFFHENSGNTDNKDSYRFSFFVNDQKELSAPKITAISPNSGELGILSLAEPVKITFNTLMMSSTLRSGSFSLSSEQDSSEHKLINLKSAAESPLGYWISSSDIDSNPLDGVVDITIAEIRHSPFLEAFTYSAQVGSGVRDVYQNCFKPSSGPGCQASWENPSCCFGIATDSLDVSGNCQ